MWYKHLWSLEDTGNVFLYNMAPWRSCVFLKLVNLKFVCVAKRRAQTYCTAGVNARPLHGDGDAVEEDDNQHNVVKHLVADDLIAHVPKPDRKQREEEMS